MEPSEKVLGTSFRPEPFGKIKAPSNSRSLNSSFYIDPSRLGTHKEYDHEAKNDWGGTGKFVEKPNSIMDNIRCSMGDIRRPGSYKSVHETPAGADSGCCPTPYGGMRNHLIKRNGA